MARQINKSRFFTQKRINGSIVLSLRDRQVASVWFDASEQPKPWCIALASNGALAQFALFSQADTHAWLHGVDPLAAREVV